MAFKEGEKKTKLQNQFFIQKVSTLFRSNSLTATMVDQYMKATCQNFLLKSLTEPINKVLDSKVNIDLVAYKIY